MKLYTSTTTSVIAISVGLLGTQCVVADDVHDSAEIDDEDEVDDDEPEDEDVEFRTLLGHLGSALGNPVANGALVASTTTAGRTNDFTPTCVGSNAPDVSYTWTAPSAGYFRFWTSKKGNLPNFDTVLHVRNFSNTSQTLGCNDNYSGAWSSLVLNLQAGQQVVIVVDGYMTATGSFNLGISTACPNGCATSPNSCSQGACDISSGACTYSPKPAGSTCSDSLVCTSGDNCDGAGSCVGNDTCSDGQYCTAWGCAGGDGCAMYGDFEDCGSGVCCQIGTNCTGLCIA